jgi:hypothetical protein
MKQQQMFDTATYDELCESNIAKVDAICGDNMEKTSMIAMLVVARRLELLIATLKGLRLLPREFEYLCEMETAAELDDILAAMP